MKTEKSYLVVWHLPPPFKLSLLNKNHFAYVSTFPAISGLTAINSIFTASLILFVLPGILASG